MISGKTAVLGVLGNPIEHTLSPKIHNTISYYTGIDQVYVAFPVDDRHGAEALIKGAFSLGVKGMNVTVPYKTQVLPYVTVDDPVAMVVGAVNTLVRTADGYKGYNTDVEGLRRALASENFNVNDRDVIILGAGGAARAALYMAITEHASHIYIMNRTIDKAEKLQAELGEKLNYNRITVLGLEDYDKIPDGDNLALQCSSVGLSDPDRAIIEDPQFYRDKVGALYDAVYKPEVTKAMRLTQDNGGVACNGLKMLLYQGVRAYELFHDISIDEKVCGDVYEVLCRDM